MSGPNSSYNTLPPNFQYDVVKYSNPYGKIAGVGCDGTKSGIDATLPKYSSPFMLGGNGYSFTDKPIGPVAGPNAPYSEIQMYNDSSKNYRDGVFPKEFKPMLNGGRKMRRKTQYGCSSKVGGRRTVRRSKRRSKRKSSKSRRNKSKRSSKSSKRSSKSKSKRSRKNKYSMRGGMSSAADYTEGRDTSQDQPYGNKAYTFGQGLDSMLGPNESGMASPPPFLPYNDCGKYKR